MKKGMKNVSPVRALSILGLLIALAAAGIYLPGLFINPSTDFVFRGRADDCYQDRHLVKDGKTIDGNLNKPAEDITCRDYRRSRLYYYDTVRKLARELTAEEAAKLTVNTSLISPDGFQIVAGKHNFFDTVFLGESSFFAQYLKKGIYSKKINLGPPSHYEFKLIGWVRTGG